MERSKNQAVYKYLPGMWVSDNSDASRPITAVIDNWNWRDMEGIYERFIVGEIKRQIRMFDERGGDITSFDVTPGKRSLRIVEAAEREGVADILGTPSPLVFYCSSCGNVFSLRSANQIDKSTWQCRFCHKYSVKQLQMIYACECGHAEPIKIPYVKGIDRFKYRPNETAYKMFYKVGNTEKTEELWIKNCPTCSNRIYPDNATANRNFRPFTLRIINLVDQRSGQFYEKGIEAQKTVVARWFDQITPEAYDNMLDNIELAFSDDFRTDSRRREVEAQVRSLIATGLVKEEQFEMFVVQMLGASSNDRSVEKYVNACDNLFAKRKADSVEEYERWISSFSFKLMQYDTLKDMKRLTNDEDSYYTVRESEPKGKYKKAGRFLYLNTYSFNGLYRVNREGKYNVPYGHRKTVYDYDILRRRCSYRGKPNHAASLVTKRRKLIWVLSLHLKLEKLSLMQG